MLEEAEDNLANIYYTEETLNFTFDRFLELHRSAHNDMLSVLNYIAPNPATRVRKLFTNFRSTNPTLLASIASVQTSTLLRNEFEQAVDALQSAVRTTNITISLKQRISALTNTVRGRVGRGERGGKGRFQRVK